jgi:hypothetical protein
LNFLNKTTFLKFWKNHQNCSLSWPHIWKESFILGSECDLIFLLCFVSQTIQNIFEIWIFKKTYLFIIKKSPKLFIILVSLMESFILGSECWKFGSLDMEWPVPGGRSWTEMFVNRNQAGMCTEPKLTSNWLPRWYSLLAAVVRLRVRNPRNRSSSETFFARKIYLWTELFVNRGVRDPRPHFTALIDRFI